MNTLDTFIHITTFLDIHSQINLLASTKKYVLDYIPRILTSMTNSFEDEKCVRDYCDGKLDMIRFKAYYDLAELIKMNKLFMLHNIFKEKETNIYFDKIDISLKQLLLLALNKCEMMFNNQEERTIINAMEKFCKNNHLFSNKYLPSIIKITHDLMCSDKSDMYMDTPYFLREIPKSVKKLVIQLDPTGLQEKVTTQS